MSETVSTRISTDMERSLRDIQLEYKRRGLNITMPQASKILLERIKNKEGDFRLKL